MPHELKENQPAPPFEGFDQDGNAITLSQFKGKKVALFFYPKDNTPTCTTEACNLRDNYAQLQAEGYIIIGVSPDSARKHRNFIQKYQLPFPLIADTERKVIEAYGVWGPKKMFGVSYEGVYRTTFIIDETGQIKRIIQKVKAKEHSQQILNNLP